MIRITFLPNVCQLVSSSASPKHPQSLTGLESSQNKSENCKKTHEKDQLQDVNFIRRDAADLVRS